jgi:6-phosphogluconolactonase
VTSSSSLSFVGTYTNADKNGIFAFRVDDDGMLQRTDAVRGGSDPTFLTPDTNTDHLYVANRPSEGGIIVAYAIDQNDGTLSRLNAAPTRGDGTPCYCSVDSTDQCVLTAQYGGGTVSVLPIEEDGCIGDPTTVIKHEGSGPNPDRQSDPHPHSILPGPDNAYAYVPDLGADQVFIYDFDSIEKTLKPAGCGHVDVHAGAGPRHLDFHPNEQYAYLINELDSTVMAFERTAETGGLNLLSTVTTLPDDFEGENLTADIHVHPSGEYLYGSNRGHDSIVVYRLDADGQPYLIDIESTRGECPRNFAIDPSGEFLFAENAETDNIVTFRIKNDGTLDPTGQVTEIPSPVCMQFGGG